MTLNVLGTVKNAEDFEVVGMNSEVETAVAVGIALQAWLYPVSGGPGQAEAGNLEYPTNEILNKALGTRRAILGDVEVDGFQIRFGFRRKDYEALFDR